MAQVPISNNNTDGTKTETLEETDSATQQAEAAQSAPTLLLRLEHPRDERRVVFHDGVIDNEHMNRMKSKCCCIYRKPLAFGESSSDDDDECEHCFGHPEKRKKNRKPPTDESCAVIRSPDQPSTSAEAQTEAKSEASKPITEGITAPVPDFETTVKPSL
ncbi:PREDICTED: protein phosphatase 1 regulatory subunit 11 [Drosophila arizonae]|uniref:E3 ubiquitin-protein ligase PPP1R11 n=1 Tax=Drosophila arizonae TaxID=7263 RepID=A0ABM1NQP6_DROAR|nr:PREDICTED: protein phosphatase 1 regulatory subunit 11 [Drosophila arizonae]